MDEEELTNFYGYKKHLKADKGTKLISA